MKVSEDLRRSVIQEAIQGRLTRQRPEDGSADDLLEDIRREKARLMGEGKLRREKILPPVSEDEVPFAIPSNWRWVRLGEVGITSTGTTPPTENKEYYHGDIPFIGPADLSLYGNINYDTDKKLTCEGKQRSKCVEAGGVLQVCIGTIGKANVAERLVCFNQQINAIEPIFVDSYYLCCVLKSPYWQRKAQVNASQTTLPILNQTKWKRFPFPLPPLGEQHRIVSKLKALMAKIDELDSLETELDTITKAFPRDMRASLLQAAIHGTLTGQHPEDGTADELLKEIRREKERLTAEGKLRREKILPPVSEDEVPFAIPSNWRWVRLGDLGEIIGGGTPSTSNSEYWKNGEVAWVTPADMGAPNLKYISRGARNITEKGLASSSARLMPRGSIIFSSRAPIGYVAIAENELCTNQGCKSVRPFNNDLSEYLYFVLLAMRNDIRRLGSGTTFKEISGKVFGSVIIPLPPLAEQQRIVKRLNDLLPLCENLEKI